jgi:hypothetical protein
VRVFENRALRRTFGTRRNEIIGRWRKLFSQKLHNFYSLPNIIRSIKLSRTRWAGRIVRLRKRRNA